MLNYSKYYSIDKLMGYNNPSFIEKMIQLFVKSANEYSINMASAIKENNLKKINELAHCIKPSIDLLNISSLITIIRDIENATNYDDDLLNKINFSKEKLSVVIKQMNVDYK